jgi:hypothetical protein
MESFIITSIVILQLCLLCIYLSNRDSRRSNFIPKYVTTPYLSTVKMTPRTRSWLRFLMLASFFFTLLSIVSWLICACGFIINLVMLFYPIFFPPVLGFVTWMLMRKAKGGRYIAIKTLLLTGLWVCSVFGDLWSLHCLLQMKFPDCSTVNQQKLKTIMAIGGVGEIMLTFMWIFLLNNIRLALKSTKPESINIFEIQPLYGTTFTNELGGEIEYSFD